MANSDNLPTHFTLNNGKKIPAIGMGTYQPKTDGAYEAVKEAVKVGYRHFDCARGYPTEADVGRALKDSEIPRSELFITSKVWPNMLRPEYVKKSVKQSLSDLQTDYVDLLLIHWPIPLKPGDEKFPLDDKGYLVFDESLDLLDTWKAFEGLVEEGVAKSIGVSNFNRRHLDHILAGCKIKPAVNQVELHPWLAQNELLQYCKEKDILLTAYAPLAFLNTPAWNKNVSDIHKVEEVANRYKLDRSQVLLSWGIQRGYSVIPKSFNAERLKTNFKVFPLDKKARAVLDSLDKGEEGRLHTPSGWGQKFDENAPIDAKDMTK